MKKTSVFVALIVIIGVAARAQALEGRKDAYNLYFGDLHSHTSFSDGQGFPEDAFEMARNEARLDFWTISDHVERLLGTVVEPGKENEEPGWDRAKRVSREKTEDGKFVALAGFEWANDYVQGHINVINIDKTVTFNDSYPLKKFYQWIHNNPEALFGFNHPSSNAELGCKVFNYFKLAGPVVPQAFYIAVNGFEDLPFYYMALDNGWWVGPSGQQDNHSRDWGVAKSGNFTAAYSDNLTNAGIIDAFKNRRIYATNERDLRLWFAGNGMPMGSKIKASNLSLDIKATHVGGKQIKSVKLVTNKGVKIDEWNPGASSFEKKVDVKVDFDDARWFLVLVETSDGRFSVSAPVQIEKI